MAQDIAQEKKPFWKSVFAPITGMVTGGIGGAAATGVITAGIGAGIGALVGQFGVPPEGVTQAAADLLGASTPENIVAQGAIGGATIAGGFGAALGGAVGTLAGGITGWANSRPDNALAQKIEVAQAEARGATAAVGLMQNAIQNQQIVALAEEQQQMKSDWAKTTRPNGPRMVQDNIAEHLKNMPKDPAKALH